MYLQSDKLKLNRNEFISKVSFYLKRIVEKDHNKLKFTKVTIYTVIKTEMLTYF